VRRVFPCVLALAFAPAAAAAPPTISIQASVVSGAAPLTVTLTAEGDAVGYRWDFGDGTSADGATVQHSFVQAGAYAVTVTGTAASGETAVTQVAVTAFRLSFAGPRLVRFGKPVRFRGALFPTVGRARITLTRNGSPLARTVTRPDGRFSVRIRAWRAGSYAARFGEIVSTGRPLTIRPLLEARIVGPHTVGQPLRLLARVRPAVAGQLRVTVWRGGRRTTAATYRSIARLRLATGRAALYRIGVRLVAAPGYRALGRTLTAAVVYPQLGLGSRGPSVLALERRLLELRYALPRADGLYALDTYEAVLAFQKVERLPWTGRVDKRVWQALTRARPPQARYRGNHIEISKGRQFLLAVRGGRVTAVVHISTGATGNTPVGRWHVYRKVPGWDWVLWYPMYFLRGFAIHGYPYVPAYPASHGCVRVPMWIAPRLYSTNPYGQTVYVYW
jgi:PKD domain/L,D-transpeptidase catalytic domain/Putative peptidoglycan binding domain